VKWLPVHRFKITSPLKRQDALSALNAHLEPAKLFRARWPSKANDKRFQGLASDDSFSIRRVLGYNNVFAPVSTGTIAAAGVGSQISVTMKPPAPALALFIGVLVLGALGMAMGGHVWMALILAAMLYVIVSCSFWFEADKQQRALREIFRAL
jgi:hypothetical protein